MDENTKMVIRKKIVELFSDDADAFTRIQFFLDEEEKAYGKDGMSPYWKSLKETVTSDKLFKQYAKRLVEDTKTAENNPNYRKLMTEIWSEIMDPSDYQASASGFEITRKGDLDIARVNASSGFAKSWSLLSPQSKEKILKVIQNVVTHKSTLSVVDKVVDSVSKTKGNVVMLGLAGVQLTYVAWQNLQRWWKGEISGERCAKNIVDSLASLGAGVAGVIAGSSLGSMAGPWGTVVGGIAGGVISGHAAMIFCDYLTQQIFRLPKSESLENAYRYFGVGMHATTEQINNKYRQLCLKHHPDKGGRQENFHELQIQMGIIKLARGQTS